jgi:hypothetical protein
MKIKIRPSLHIGDIVKLSKKGRMFPRTFSKHVSMVVTEILGDGKDHASVITCKIKHKGQSKYHSFYRSELWYTGKKVSQKIKKGG